MPYTSKYMLKAPLITMKILGNQFLSWCWLRHVLNNNFKHRFFRDYAIREKKETNKNETDGVSTKGGRHSVACFLRTEKPPCVLVSEAVKILQNE